jgi:hypothetical protein
MKMNILQIAVVGISTLAATSSMGQRVGVQINVPAPVITVPAPAVTVQTPAVTVQAVPDSYAWDGTEYVGVVGTSYFYLGAGDVWLPLDGPRLTRFNGWARDHGDWRSHMVRNEKYRHDAKGHEVPLRDDHAVPASHDIRDSHDAHGDQGHPDGGHDDHR